ncbi:hypothetical protein B9479_000405 [Cryptococcus floricola]|uniref:RRM domain-containing protein n=1 Tax=Cryptococcus floricola TaxID=2591691 RepID=A0A5D3B9C1_9TREE|nr:hypothetical protein B9479_000405 [Cryptococcus floricola]
MDVDKSLDDIIATKKQDNRPKQAQRPPAPRHSTGSNGGSRPTPYARPPPRSTGDRWVHDAYPGRGGFNGRQGRAAPNPLIAGTGATFTKENQRIEIVGLHYEVSNQDLKTIFSQAGTIAEGPQIRYDRSGRSTGAAWIEYTTVAAAKNAINKFDGAMTKGQTISIRYGRPPPVQNPGPANGAGPGPARNGSTASLLSRIQPSAPAGGKVPKGPKGAANAPPVREANGNGAAGAARGGRRGRGGRGGRGGGARGERPGPKSAGDLDSELDNFMKPADSAGDVEMA